MVEMTSISFGRLCLFFGIFILFFIHIRAPPVTDKKPASDKGEGDPDDPSFYNLEYERYLQEVVQVLESDPDFRAKLEKADPEDVKNGKIAEELDFLHHDVRSKLHEIKRREIERLRKALREQMERDNGAHNLVMPSHLDHGNLDTFEKEDLKKLIHKTTKDLEELDVKRREEYKQYEMEKEIEWRQKLANMTEEERLNATKEREAAEARHKKHPEINHPGSKTQLEQVWEEVDNLPKDSFDPKTFFNLHDLSGDGVLDTGELEALFQKELDKVYDKNNPDDDMHERDEEMARMREHVMKEVDVNKDGEEFMTAMKNEKPTKDDDGWETLDEQKKVYSEEDLKNFAQQWAKEHNVPVQNLYPQQGGYPQGQPHQQQYGQYPNQYPNQPNQYPNQQYPPYQQQQFGQQPVGHGQQQFQQGQPQFQGQPQQFQGQQQFQQPPPQQYQQQQFQGQQQQPYKGQQVGQQQQQNLGQVPVGQQPPSGQQPPVVQQQQQQPIAQSQPIGQPQAQAPIQQVPQVQQGQQQQPAH